MAALVALVVLFLRLLTNKTAVQADDFWYALALVLVIEGLLPFVAPAVWRETFTKILALQDGQIRFIGLVAVALGLGAIWLLS